MISATFSIKKMNHSCPVLSVSNYFSSVQLRSSLQMNNLYSVRDYDIICEEASELNSMSWREADRSESRSWLTGLLAGVGVLGVLVVIITVTVLINYNDDTNTSETQETSTSANQNLTQHPT